MTFDELKRRACTLQREARVMRATPGQLIISYAELHDLILDIRRQVHIPLRGSDKDAREMFLRGDVKIMGLTVHVNGLPQNDFA